MTDIAKVDNEYYAAKQYVQPTATQNELARVQTELVYPLLQSTSDYQVALNKAKIPTDGVPLTQNNIPLKLYQVGIKNGTTEQTAYVRQLNSTTGNYSYTIKTNGDVVKTPYSSSGVIGSQSILFNASSYLTNIPYILIDDFENVYLAGNNGGIPYNKFYIFSSAGTVIFSQTFISIQGLAIDRSQNIYIAYETLTESEIQVYSNTNSAGGVVLTLTGTISLDANGNPLSEIQTICVDNQIVVGCSPNLITIYNSNTLAPITTFNETTITQVGRESAILSSEDRFCLSDNGASSNYLLGIKSGGSTTIDIMEIGTPLGDGGAWIDTAKMAYVNGYMFGINSSTGKLWAFTYNQATGVCGTPFVVNNIVSGLDSVSNSAQSTGVFALDGGNLYALNGDNNLTLNNLCLSDASFKIGGGTTITNMDTFPTSGNTLACGSDGNLYISSAPILPRLGFPLYSGNLVSNSDGAVQIVQDGIGWNLPSTTTSYTLQQNFTNISSGSNSYSYNAFGGYKSGSNLYVLVERYDFNTSTTKLYVLLISLPTYTIISIFDVSTAVGNLYGFCQLGTSGYFAISNSNNTIYLFSESTGTSLGTFTLSSTLPASANRNFQMDGMTVSGTNYLLVSVNTNVELWKIITSPFSATNLMAEPFSPSGGYPSQFVQGIRLVLDTGGTSISGAWLTSNGMDAGEANTTLFSVGIIPSGGSFIFASATMIDDTKNYASCAGNSEQNCIYTNANYNEFYVAEGDPVANNSLTGVVYTYSYSPSLPSSRFTGQFTLTSPTSGITNQFLSTFIMADTITGSYSWTVISQPTSPVSVGCCSISQINTGTVFVVSTTGTTYKGTFGTSMLFSPYTVAGTYSNILAILPPSGWYDGSISNFSISSQTPAGTYNVGFKVEGLSRNEISGEFLASYNNTLNSFSPTAFTQNWTSAYSDIGVIFAKNGQDIDAGNYAIYSFSVLVNAINVALLEAYNKFPTGTFSEAPYITLDYATGLVSLNYSADYTTVGNGILFNNSLIRLIYFTSTVDTIDSSLNKITLPLASTSITQSGRTIYAFNELDKIIFISNTLSVKGSYFGNNNSNNIIATVDVLTDVAGYTDNIGEMVDYQPNFLRPYMLSTNIPLQRMELEVWYETTSGQQYPLYIVPTKAWSAQLIFIRRY